MELKNIESNVYEISPNIAIIEVFTLEKIINMMNTEKSSDSLFKKHYIIFESPFYNFNFNITEQVTIRDIMRYLDRLSFFQNIHVIQTKNSSHTKDRIQELYNNIQLQVETKISSDLTENIKEDYIKLELDLEIIDKEETDEIKPQDQEISTEIDWNADSIKNINENIISILANNYTIKEFIETEEIKPLKYPTNGKKINIRTLKCIQEKIRVIYSTTN